MKRLLLVWGTCAWLYNVHAQCPEVNITLTTQAEVDNFAANYPGCTEMPMSITLDEGISSLSGLSQITSINESFRIIDNSALTSLSGLENLTSVGANLEIMHNDNLNSLSGLENLTTVGGDFWIHNNDSLDGLTVIGSLNSIGEDLKITDNSTIETFAGLENVTSLGGDLVIDDNGALISLNGLENIPSSEGLSIVGNDLLANLEPLNITLTGGNLLIISNNVLTDISALENITYVDSWVSIHGNPDLTSLMGLHNITAIRRGLTISANGTISNLMGLESLTSVGAHVAIRSNNNLTDLMRLHNLDSIGGYLFIKENHSLKSLSGLNNLAYVGEYLTIEYNDSLNSLDLNSISYVGGDMTIYSNGTIDMPFSLGEFSSLVTTEGDLNIRYNFGLVDLRGLESLTSIGGDLILERNFDLVNLAGLENLTSIGGGMFIENNDDAKSLIGLNSLMSIGESLFLYGNNDLESLTELSNLTSIGGLLRVFYNGSLVELNGLHNIDHNTITELSITHNENLNICNISNICNYLMNGNTASIFLNGPGCYSEAILDNCDNLPKVSSDIFQDLDQNGFRDSDEPDLYGISISLEPTYNNIITNQATDGVFYLQPGSYTATYNQAANPNWVLSTNPSSYIINLAEGDCDTIAFGLYPNQNISEIISTIASPANRCNEIITFDISTKNLGTTTANGTMWLQIDETIDSLNFINTPDTIVAPNRYGWFFDALYPSYSIEKQIALQILGPPDFPVGDSLVFHAYVDFEDENGAQTSQTFTYIPEVRCSYDPNDKLVNPSRVGDYTLFDEDLIYTVRFQNTGNDVAYDVVIRDTLDANLDLTSFRVLGSSHADRLNTSMRENGILNFEFRDIFLPDSTSNFEGSQGYVSYLIRTIDGLAENTPVTNSAGIYFDLNPPVITNTVQSVMVSELPTVSVQSPENELNFNITPNPNTGSFHVQGATNGTYRIFNTMGQIIHFGELNNDTLIDISQVASGVYFIEIREEERVGTRRFVRQ